VLTMIMVSISLVMSVIVTNIYMRKDSSTPVPRHLRRLFLRDVVASSQLTAPLPPPPPPPTLNGNLRHAVASCQDGGVWTTDGRVLDDVDIRSSHRPHRKAVDSLRVNDVDDDFNVAPFSRDLAAIPESPRRRDRAVSGGRCTVNDSKKAEWKELARVVDRLFFWLFVISSAGLLTALYVSVAESSSSTHDSLASK